MEMKCNSSILKVKALKNGRSLTLKEATTEDAKSVLEYLNVIGGESDNLLFGEGAFPFSLEEEMDIIDDINRDASSIMLLGIIDNKLVSLGRLSTPLRDRIKHNTDLSISVRKEYWHMGIGTEVMNELISFAKNTNSIKNITLGVREDNIAGINLYEKFGFEKVGLHRDYFNIKGEYFHEILMDLHI